MFDNTAKQSRRQRLNDLLAGPRPVLLDGSTGNCLIRRHGIPAGECMERWILANSGKLVQLQREYVEAGTRILCAPTFGANRASLSKYKLGDEVRRYNEELAALSFEAACGGGTAAGDYAFVAGDISPTGLFLLPYGETSYAEMYKIFAEQAEALERAGVDLFLLETQLDLAEARCALAAVKSVSDAPVFVSMTVDKLGRTMSGNGMDACLASLYAAGADGIGCNCSVGPDQMLQTMRQLAPLAAGYVPLLAKANAGLPHDDGCGHTCFDCDVDEFTRIYGDILACGVKFIGGCCGTDPEYIAKLRELAQVMPDIAPAAASGDLANRCASDRKLFEPLKLSGLPEPIECGPDLQGKLMDAQDENVPVMRINVGAAADAAVIAECSAYIDRPLMLGSSDGGALLAAALQYPGRIAVDPDAPEDVKQKLLSGYKAVRLDL